jgi:hypothetical protein
LQISTGRCKSPHDGTQSDLISGHIDLQQR